MFNFDPIHWAAVGLGATCVGLGIYCTILNAELDTARVTNRVVEVIGHVQDANTKKEDKESATSKEEVENEYGKIITAMHIDAERLRNKIARGSNLPKSVSVCTSTSESTSIDWPLINEAIGTYRSRVSGLVKQGSEAEAALNAIKMWVKKEAT